MPFYAVGLQATAISHVEADNEEEAGALALSDEEDWGRQLAKSIPVVAWVEDAD